MNTKTNYSDAGRPATVQELLRRFAAGNPPGRPERVRYLAEPCYKEIEGRTWTLAGDGWVYLWLEKRVQGFRDYEVPPPGMGYVEVPEVLGRLRQGAAVQTEVPSVDGPAGPRCVQEVRLAGGGRAVVRRVDLQRLLALDWCRLGPGPVCYGGLALWQNGAVRWLVFQGNFGGHAVRGIVECLEPRDVVRRGVRRPVSAAQKRGKNGAKMGPKRGGGAVAKVS